MSAAPRNTERAKKARQREAEELERRIRSGLAKKKAKKK